MNDGLKQVIEACSQASHAGQISFGEAVGRLAQAGVQSYHVDYRKGEATYYGADDSVYAVLLGGPRTPPARQFDAPALQRAIRGAQAGAVLYPEFLALSRAAGCVAYTVWISGRHVAYAGRTGELHIEHFPN